MSCRPADQAGLGRRQPSLARNFCRSRIACTMPPTSSAAATMTSVVPWDHLHEVAAGHAVDYRALTWSHKNIPVARSSACPFASASSWSAYPACRFGWHKSAHRSLTTFPSEQAS